MPIASVANVVTSFTGDGGTRAFRKTRAPPHPRADSTDSKPSFSPQIRPLSYAEVRQPTHLVSSLLSCQRLLRRALGETLFIIRLQRGSRGRMINFLSDFKAEAEVLFDCRRGRGIRSGFSGFPPLAGRVPNDCDSGESRCPTTNLVPCRTTLKPRSEAAACLPLNQSAFPHTSSDAIPFFVSNICAFYPPTYRSLNFALALCARAWI